MDVTTTIPDRKDLMPYLGLAGFSLVLQGTLHPKFQILLIIYLPIIPMSYSIG